MKSLEHELQVHSVYNSNTWLAYPNLVVGHYNSWLESRPFRENHNVTGYNYRPSHVT